MKHDIIDISLMILYRQILFTRVAWARVCSKSSHVRNVLWVFPSYSLSVTLQWHNKSTLCLAAESFKSDIFTSEPLPGVSIFSFGHSLECSYIPSNLVFLSLSNLLLLCHFIQIESDNSQNTPQTNDLVRNDCKVSLFIVKMNIANSYYGYNDPFEVPS